MKFKYYEQQLTTEELDYFEKQINIQLPKSYREIIKKYNGGIPEIHYFRGGVVSFTSIKYGDYTVEEAIKLLKDVIPQNSYPFADISGMTLVISLNQEDYGKIYCIDETGESELVSNSFDDFMAELSDDPDY